MNISGTPSLDKMSNIYNNSAVRFYQYVFHDLSDPRTREWFMIASPVPGVSLLIGYLYFCLSWGPRQMEHRKPYKLRNVLVVYNFLQVLLSFWLFYEGLDGAWLRKYSWKCQPVDFSTSPEAMRRRVHIFSGEDLRAARHGVLRAKKEGQPDHVPPPVPSHGDADDLVGSHQVLSGRPWNIHRCHQQLRPHHYVHLLPAGCAAASIPEVPVVEEVHHDPPNGPILPGLPAQLPAAVLRLRLPEVVAVLHPPERDLLLLPVRGLLRRLVPTPTQGVQDLVDEGDRRAHADRERPVAERQREDGLIPKELVAWWTGQGTLHRQRLRATIDVSQILFDDQSLPSPRVQVSLRACTSSGLVAP